MSTETPQATLDLISTLEQLHPTFKWEALPIGDYDQNATFGTPEVLIYFSNAEIDLCEQGPDPFSDYCGSPCDPSHWGLSPEAAELIRGHNKIDLGRLDDPTSPFFTAPTKRASTAS
ncbi:hypothetical protein [Pseudomonas fragi]|uniref:hypothetical protein n=1 Tax=Pseudomonas fragi TaxID=296 RepID=UPI00147370E9|nr:hypothetical protein [Pseudomonas fragi]NNB34000.1 hypothetical protein [Pseudomonas fragi]